MSLRRWVFGIAWTLTGACNAAYDFEGVAIDPASSQPLAGVHVAATWERHRGGFHGSTHSCAHVATAVTGPDGRFLLKGPEDVVKDPLGMSAAFHAHLAGRESDLPNNGALLMQPVTTDRNDRIHGLLQLISFSIPCTKSTAGMKAYAESVAAEARSLASTPWERMIAEVIALRARDPLNWSAYSEPERELKVAYMRSGDTDPDGRDVADQTPLMRAADAGDLAGVERELSRGAKVNRMSGHVGALHLAVRRYTTAKVDKHIDVERRWALVQALLAVPGIDPDRVGDRYKPLIASEAGHPELVEALMKAGANPNFVSGGTSGLEAVIANRRGRTDAQAAEADRAMRLVTRDPRTDLNAAGGRGVPVLFDCVSAHHEATVRELLEAGANPNVKSTSGKTPLALATESAMMADHEPRRVVLRLLASHPKIDLRDVRAARDTALKGGRADLVAILSGPLDRS